MRLSRKKSRALYERQGRARDVYDVVHLSRAFRESVDIATTVRVANAKFSYKGLPAPSVDVIVGRIDEGILRANWEHQLAHQLPVLPDVGGFIDSLPEALAWWLEPARLAPQSPPIPGRLRETTAPREPFLPRGPMRSLGIGSRSPLGLRGIMHGPSLGRIKYAAHNRLCLQIRYKGVTRIVEPYSLRYPRTGNTLLYVWERQRGGIQTDQIKAFNMPRIQGVEVTDQSFEPRYHVEL